MVNTEIQLIILFAVEDGDALYTAKIRPVADFGSDHQLLIAKFSLKLKNSEKTARPFRYDLNQISYYYTVEVTNRFKGLDQVDRVSEELWMEAHNIVQEVVRKTISKKRKIKMAKWLFEEALQVAEKRREEKNQRKMGKIY